MAKDKYKKNITIDTIRKILLNIKKTIANEIKHVYRSKQNGWPPEANKILVIDESLFLPDLNNNQIWAVGAIEADY